MAGSGVYKKEKPVLWARLAVNHTKKLIALGLLIPIALGFITVRFGGLSFSPPGGGRDFLVRNDERTEKIDALTAARQKYELDKSVGERTERSFIREFNILLRSTKDGSIDKPAAVDISVPGTNILTPEGLSFLKKAEDKIINDGSYERFCYNDQSFDCEGNKRKCALPFSITNHPFLYGIPKPGSLFPCDRKDSSEPVSKEAFERFISTVVDPTTNNINPQVSIFWGKDATPENLETQILRSYVRFGTPIANTTDAETDGEKQAAFEEWAAKTSDGVQELTNEKFHVYVDSFSLFGVRFNPVIFRDLAFSFAAIAVVWFVVRLHTTSTFLANFTIIQVLYSFPLSLFVYAVMFRITYFATLQVMTIFLILGIGADDVFVFTDAWKQAPVFIGNDVTLEERMSFAYKRAVKAMSVTSFTTAAAFFSTATSPIVPISTFGVFAALLVLLQFVLVITLYPAVLIVWYRFWRGRKWYRCFKAPEDNEDDTVPEPTEDLGEKTFMQRVRGLFNKKKTSEDELRPIEKFFNGFWTDLTLKLKWPLVVIGVALLGVSIWLATKLDTPEEAEKFLPDDFPSQQASLILRNDFPSFDDSVNVNVQVVWGLSGIDRDGISRYNFDDVGEPILDESFSLRTAEAQQRVLDSCSFFSNEARELVTSEESIPDKVTCWIKDFAEYRATFLNAGTSFQTYATEKDLANAVLDFTNFATPQGIKPYEKYIKSGYVGFDEQKEKIIFTYTDFVTPLREDDPYSKTWPAYENWEKALEEFKSGTVAEGVKNPFQASGQWSSAVLQNALVSNMFQGIGIVLGISIISLSVSTGNVIVSFLALVSITGILVNVLAMIYLLGWALGVIESIGVVLSVGFSFDYVAHLANAYTESDKGVSRVERTRSALTELGISVLAGAISTLGAASMLFFAIVVFFTKIGVLIVATIALALIWSLGFFPAFLHAFGPTKNMGELMPVVRKILPCLPKKEKSSEESTSPSDV